jgi:hypothetical protein
MKRAVTGGVVQGQPELFYKMSKNTEKNVLEALVLSLRSLRAAGAQRLLTLHDSYTEYTSGPESAPQGEDKDIADAAFEEWLKGVERRGAAPHQLQTLSAHQVLLLSLRRTRLPLGPLTGCMHVLQACTANVAPQPKQRANVHLRSSDVQLNNVAQTDLPVTCGAFNTHCHPHRAV